MSGNIGYIKIGVFSEKKRVSEHLWCPEGVGVSLFFVFFLGGGGLFFPGAGLLKQ